MPIIFNSDKISNVFIFNMQEIKDNSYKMNKYNYLLENPNNIVVLPNDKTTKKNKFAKTRDSIYKEIRNENKFCEGLTALYVKESLKTCDAIFKIESSMTRSKKMYGFATIKFIRNKKSLYIDTICTNSDVKGTGTYMIKFLAKLSEKLSLESIKLNSATQSVPFYLKTDFECDDVCKMTKKIEPTKQTKKIKKRTTKSVRKH